MKVLACKDRGRKVYKEPQMGKAEMIEFKLQKTGPWEWTKQEGVSWRQCQKGKLGPDPGEL